jgi:hypothetical protein
VSRTWDIGIHREFLSIKFSGNFHFGHQLEGGGIIAVRLISKREDVRMIYVKNLFMIEGRVSKLIFSLLFIMVRHTIAIKV